MNMKLTLLLTSALLSLALASPVANPDPQASAGVGKCFCKAPICPLEIIAVRWNLLLSIQL